VHRRLFKGELTLLYLRVPQPPIFRLNSLFGIHVIVETSLLILAPMGSMHWFSSAFPFFLEVFDRGADLPHNVDPGFLERVFPP